MLILLRHGQSLSNAAGILVGRSDPPLTALGLRQAEAAAGLLAAELQERATDRPVVVLSSPLARARLTAEVVASKICSDVDFRIDERLIELDYGELDGLGIAEVDPSDWAAWRMDPGWRPPGGETLEELCERVWSFCEQLVTPACEADVIAVSHVSPIKAAASWALGAGPELSWRLSLGIASITRIVTSPLSLRTFGEMGHVTLLT
ncbi:MAG: histidine phosphatase family protein [Acidimicrobiales bacterium]